MEPRAWPILLFVIAIICTCANARNPVTVDIIAISMDQQITNEREYSKEIPTGTQLCTYCQEFAAQAEQYLSQNATESEIISILHEACSHTHGFKHQCVLLVDYYAPIFFVEVAKVQPELFCEKVNLCNEIVSVSLEKRDDACALCHRVVSQVLAKLEDPDTQFEIIETLLKACNKVENYVQECKKLVFEYGPIIIANAERFIEKTDICASIHACKAGKRATSSLGEILIASA